MRLTTRTNLAVRVLMFCAVHEGRIVRSAQIAERCNASPHHLAQVVYLLNQRGFVRAIRGRAGGLELARPPAKINIGEVFELFESGVPFAECFSDTGNTCPLTDACRLRTGIARAVAAFYAEMGTMTLEDLVRDNCALAALMTLEGVPETACAV